MLVNCDQNKMSNMKRDPQWTICGENLCFLDPFEDKIRILKLINTFDELLVEGKPEIFGIKCEIIDFSIVKALD